MTDEAQAPPQPQVRTLPEDVRHSLTAAGIGPRLHHQTLGDYGKMGEGFVKWLEAHAQKVRKDGFGAIFEGAGWGDGLHLLCRVMHIKGIGCRVVPLVRMTRVVYGDSEFREDVEDAQVLCILKAADSRRGCPLKYNAMDETEWMIRKRFENGRSTFISMSTDAPWRELDNRYWSDEFVGWLDEHFGCWSVDQIEAGEIE